MLLFLILFVRLHAFLGLLITSMALGLACGMKPLVLIKSIQSGVGDALGFIAVVLGLGAMIGAYLEHSGGGGVLADWLLKLFGRERAVWAVLIASFLVGLPIFFEVGFIILVPLVWSLARESKRSLLFFGMAMCAPLTITHSLVPPHPAPAAAAQLLGADLGTAILYGALLSIPMSIVGGILYGAFIGKRIFVPVPKIADSLEPAADEGNNPPPIALVVLLLIMPVVLILAATVAGTGNATLTFLGHPFTALAVTALACMYFFGVRRGLNRDELAKLAMKSFAPAGSLLLIMGGGGAFKQVIVDTGAGAYAGKLLAASHFSPLLLAFVVAVGMRAAQGSATVAIITAAGIVAPLVKSVVGYRPEMIYLAVCCGGGMLSHVNDAGFWIVNQYFGMTVPQTLKSWTVMKIVSTFFGFGLVLLAQAFLGSR
ncbi:MAG: gluconate transporter [Bryobacterales bacterium]|nr:gluconate transporter [Bryobacterales bacterium]